MKITNEGIRNELPKWAFEKPFDRSFPVIFLFCKKNTDIEILESDIGAGSVRLLPDGYKYNETGYDDNYLVRKSKKAFENGANCVITGYYNTVEDKWIEFKVYDIEMYTTSKNVEIVNETMIFAHNASYHNKDCYLENIKSYSEENGFKYSSVAIPDNINVLKVYDFMKESFFKNNKLKNKNSGFYYLNEKDIFNFFKENNIPIELNYLYNIFNIMRVANVANIFVMDKTLKENILVDMFDLTVSMSNKIRDGKMDEIIMVFGYHDRFIKVFGEIN